MQTIIDTKLSQNRGKPRVWIEGRKLAVGFNAGDTYSVTYDKQKKLVKLQLDKNGTQVVCKRTKKDRIEPLIELRDNELLDLFDYDTRLTIRVTKGLVTCSVNAIEAKNQTRAQEFLEKIVNGEPLSKGTLFTGGGIIDRAIHEGLKCAGIDSKVKLVVETEKMYLESFLSNQADMLADDALIFNSKIEDIDLDEVEDFKLDLLLCTLPCTAASKAGRTKNALEFAEQHESAGSCFYYALNFIKKFQVANIVMENVKEFLNVSSYAVIKSVLTNWGYSVKEKVLNSNEFGAIENRDRLCMVANLKSLNDFDFNYVIPVMDKPESLKECLEEISVESDEWRDFDYLKSKQIRDKANGKGFGVTLYKGDEPSVITIRRTYHKGGSCDPYVVHPNNPELWRLFTAKEHLRIKGIPENLVDGCSNTIAHEIAGQSGCYYQWLSVGIGVGINILNSAKVFSKVIKLANGVNTNVFEKFGKHSRIINHHGKGFILLSEQANQLLESKGVFVESAA